MLMRRGASLLELLVALTLATLVLGTATGSVLRQQRAAAWQASRLRSESQLRAGVAELPGTLAGLSPASGDIAPGEGRDTALQLRAAMANGFACDSVVGQVTLAVGDTSTSALTGVAALPELGDTLWWYSSGERQWVGRRITDVRALTAACGVAARSSTSVLRITIGGLDTLPRGAPVRITRQVRYSVYRAGDGSWQLGLSEWSEVARRFASPQPIAGPFLHDEPGGARTGFRYFDADGVELSELAFDVARIARLRITMLSADPTSAGVRRDSADVAFAPTSR